MSKCKTTVITFEEFTDLEFKAPSAFYLRNSLGEYVYFHTRDRSVAQGWANEIYGVGFYNINGGKMGKAPESQSAVGRINSRSRAGSRPVK